MKVTFVELAPFERHRAEYLTDDQFQSLQKMLIEQPHCGDVIQHTGGLRKVRFKDERRNKGKRGGLRVIYYWWSDEGLCYLLTLYDKDELEDLTPQRRELLAQLLDRIKKEAAKNGREKRIY